MNERRAKPCGNAEPDFFRAGRWWFLGDGFRAFDDDPIGQGYEVVIRHPGFRSSAVASVLGIEDTPPWTNLSLETRDSFYFQFKRDLQQMGLVEVTYLGPKAVTFDCREGVESILTGIGFEIRRLVHLSATMRTAFPEPKGEHDRTRIDPMLLSFAANSINPAMVTLRWEPLICDLRQRRRYKKLVPYSYEHILSAVETFLTRNVEYQRHVQKCARPRSVKAGNGQPRPKKRQAVAIALGCIAHDWRNTQLRRKELFAFCTELLVKLDVRICPRWDNFEASFAKLHRRIKLSPAKRNLQTVQGLTAKDVSRLLFPSTS